MSTNLRQTNKPKLSQEKQRNSGNGPSLKGTFASVMLLGAFLVITWAAVFILFMVRQ